MKDEGLCRQSCWLCVPVQGIMGGGRDDDVSGCRWGWVVPAGLVEGVIVWYVKV